MSQSKGEQVRSGLKHPVFDADGHWLEIPLIFSEYLGEVAGPKMVDRYLKDSSRHYSSGWYTLTAEDRARNRIKRPGWWHMPNNIQDRAAAMIPKRLYERLDAWGIDVCLLYPTLGLTLPRLLRDDELRQALIRAYNVMTADMFKPYSDRLIPVATIAVNTPAEMMAQIEHAHSLGLKAMMMNAVIPREIAADAAWQPDPAKRRVYIDALATDSPYDYDPVWARCVELKVAVTNHGGSIGWPDRSSPSNFMLDHLGHFAQANHCFARSLFVGGVTERFPTLNFGFLEGGVGWACNLYSDLFGHWDKRNMASMHKHLDPAQLDRAALRKLMLESTSGNTRFEGKIDEILAHSLYVLPNMSQQDLSARDFHWDEFAKVGIKGPEDIRRLFAQNFYFGCEADDPMTAVAFDKRLGLTLKPMLGSDIGHFDVIDGTEVLHEAWEMVEHGLINEQDFREFTFGNAVHLHGGMNPDFFKGTVIEEAARQELATTGH